MQPPPLPFPDPADGSTEAMSQVGPYRLFARVAAMDEWAVFQAVHVSTGRTVALYLLNRVAPAAQRHPWEDVRSDAFHLFRLRHPHVALLLDGGTSDGRPFVATESHSGGDLRSKVRDEGPLTIPDACRVIGQAARGLAALHDLGIVHGEVRPANLLLTGKGDLKLLNPVLWCFPGAEPDERRTPYGHLVYCATEFCTGEVQRPTPATDLYALGCTLFYSLTGGLPYQGSSHEVAYGHGFAPIPDLRAIRSDAPVELARVVRQLLAKRPEERGAMVHVAEALDNIARTQPGGQRGEKE